MGKPITVLLAEDNEDLRAIMASVLDAEADIRCVAQTGELDAVVELARAHGPSVIVLDIELHGQSSLLSLPSLKKELPAARILVYSGHALPAIAQAALSAGATEYMLKSGDPYELIDAVRRCGAGTAQ